MISNPYFRDYVRDAVDDPFESQLRYDAEDLFVAAAETRLYVQQELFEFGVWNMMNAMEGTERLDDYFCPSAAWGCEIPGLIWGTVGLMAGFAPLVVFTWSPYTNPFVWITAPLAFAMDSYNLYQFFD